MRTYRILVIYLTNTNTNLGDLISTYDTAAGEALGKRESHTPKIEAPETINADEPFELKVIVGPHPNTVEHSISGSRYTSMKKGDPSIHIMLSRVELAPVLSEPSVMLKTKLQKSGVLHAVEYCNLHGLWSGKKEIEVIKL